MTLTSPVTGATFDSTEPSTGAVVATFRVDGPAEVAAALSAARSAGAWWAGLGFDGRRRVLDTYRALLVRRIDDLAALVHRENGKPLADARREVWLAAEHLRWAARHARRVLGLRHVRPGLTAWNHAAWLEYQPLGVVGVIGPWNYPVFTPLGSIGYALAAGNAVVFKPSEHTTAVGRWLADAFSAVVDGRGVWQTVTGDGTTGAALCRAGVDKLAFTGSAATGRKVMAACAPSLTPVLMECGGKAPVIVDDDADVDLAAAAAVWGGLHNAGQACVAVERVYATDAVYDRLVARVTELAGRVRAGGDGAEAIGPMTTPEQLAVVSEHLRDALARGARAVVGGRDAVRPPYVDPVVLVDVPDDAAVLREETFGPVLPIVRVRDADEAVRRANASGSGLSSAVFTRRGHRGVELARRVRAGMASVNSALAYVAVPALPFGGVGESGFGRVHGDDGLREFARAKSITRRRVPTPLNFLAFATPPVDLALAWIMRARHARRR